MAAVMFQIFDEVTAVKSGGNYRLTHSNAAEIHIIKNMHLCTRLLTVIHHTCKVPFMMA